MKKALIFGISGQDGTLLADFLLKKGYEIYGTSRDIEINEFKGLIYLNIKNQIKLCSLTLTDYKSVLQVIEEISPDEIYNLAGETSVAISFQNPIKTTESIVNGTFNILEALKVLNLNIKFFNASSSECFGNSTLAATESTKFNPVSPYAEAKRIAFLLVKKYRENYNLFTCSGILSNHESVFRNSRFISKKIVESAYNISIGKQDYVEFGDITIIRDWGWAPEYVEAMYMMMQQDFPDDFIIATGKSISLQKFIEYSFQKFNLDYLKYIRIDESLIRNTEIKSSSLNPEKALTKLGWAAKNDVFSMIDMLIEEKIHIKNNLSKAK